MADSKKGYISVLNVIACLAVVMLHANDVFWEFSRERYWVTANLIESVCYFAVPIFFMSSGATLIDYRKRYGTKLYMKKRFGKTFIPFLFWSFFGLFYLCIAGKMELGHLNVSTVFESVLNTEYVPIYWFFPALFPVYFCIPIFGLIPEAQRKKVFGYIIAISFLLNSLCPFLSGLLGIQYNYGFIMPLGNNYLIYILIGYYLDQYDIKKGVRISIYVLGLVGLCMHCLGTWYCCWQTGYIVQTFKGYLNVPCILYSSAVFLAFRSFRFRQHSSRIFDKLSGLTFGIYLIHWYFFDAILTFTEVNRYSIIYRVLGGVGVFVVSGILIRLLKKLSWGRMLVP